MKKNRKNGFTLLELLIVIAIIAILSVALVIVLNPAETLKKARDAQRISDLSTLKTAIGLYMTSVSPVYLGGAASNAICKTTASTSWGSAGTFKISYSLPIATPITDASLDVNGTGAGGISARQAAVTPGLTDGTGWIPVNFGAIAGGTPISNVPVDPINTVTSVSALSSTDLVYRYGCTIIPAFEIDAVLESTAYVTTDPKMTTDGGNSTAYYETGTDLGILGMGTNNTDY